MKTVSCKYPNYFQEYSFKTCVADVRAGDLLVAKSSQGLGVVEVVSVDTVPNPKAKKWAFQRVDETLLSGLEAAEVRRQELLSLLKRKAEARSRYSEFEVIATTDKEADAALTELRSIDEEL